MVSLNFGASAQMHPAVLAPQSHAHLQRISLNLSASQAKTWDLCRRVWWLFRVAKLNQPQKQHFATGHALHAVAELYLKGDISDWSGLFPAGWDRHLDPDGKEFVPFAAKQAIELGLWQRVPGILIEEPIALLVGREHLDERGMPLLAKAEAFMDKDGIRRIAGLVSMLDGSPLPPGYDRLSPLVGFVDVGALNRPVPRVSDHKSARNRRYTLSKAKLAEDRQVRIYSCWALAQRKDVTECEVEHIVFLKNLDAPEPAFSTVATIPLEDARKDWLEVIAMAEDMKLVREAVPVVVDPANPYNRADQWKRVLGAIDEGPERAKESCGAYGGCVFKDVCTGRSTAAEVVKRLDTPSLMSLVKKVTAPLPFQSFGLNISTHTTQPPTKDIHMPFAPAAAIIHEVGSDVYIIDETDKSVQFRARVLARLPNGKSAVGLWPHPDIEPHWPALPAIYKVDLDPATFFATPAPSARVGGYQAELVNAKVPDENAWYDTKGNLMVFPDKTAPAPVPPKHPLSPAPAHTSPLTGHVGPAAPPGPADGFTDTKITRPPRDPASTPLGLTATPLIHSPGITVTMGTPPPPAASKSQALANQLQSAVAAEQANEVPPPAFEPKVGDMVEFLPTTTHKFWAGFAGKHATVTDVSLGENQLIVSVICDGVEYPDLQSGRFKLVSRPAAKAPAPPQPALPAVAAATLAQSATAPAGTPVTQQAIPGVPLLPATLEEAQALAGKSIVFQAIGSAPFNAPLTAVDAEGATILGYKHPWNTVARLSLLTPTDIPGAKPPKPVKLTKEQKAEAKAQEEKAAQLADRMNALNQAHQLVAAVLKSEGKVTKKAFETLLPLLEAAVVWQGELTATATGGAPAPSPATPEIAAALQAARDNLDLVVANLGLA